MSSTRDAARWARYPVVGLLTVVAAVVALGAFPALARASQVTGVTATNTPPSSAAGAQTTYIVGFTTSASGGLSGDSQSQITIALPAGTGVSSLTGFVTETGSTQRLGNCNVSSGTTVTCPLFSGSTIAASTAVTVELDAVVNPTSTGTKTLTVATTADTTAVTSAGYSVTAASTITQPTVTDTPPSAAAGAQTTYLVAFTTSATGGLSGGAGSQITIVLPAGTGVSSLTGFVTETGSTQRLGNCNVSSGTTVTCPLFSGSTIAASTAVTVELDAVVNPTTAGAMTLTVATTSDTAAVTSGRYQVTTANTLSQPTVTDTPPSPAAGAQTTYLVAFTTSATGGLSGGAGSQITIVLPAGTGVSSLTGFVTETGSTQRLGNCNVSSGTTVTCPLFSGSTIAASTAVTVELDAVVNPTSTGTKTLTVATTSDTAAVTSAGYSITAAQTITQPSVTDTPTSSGASTVYLVGFTTSSTGGLSGGAGSQITIVLPAGTGVSSLTGFVTETGSTQRLGNCNVSSGTTVTCPLFSGSTIAASTAVTVELDAVVNPTSTGTKTLTVATTSDTAPVTSAGYAVTSAGQVSQPTVSDTPPSPAAGALTTYLVGFTTSASGGLSGDASSQITIVLPAGTGVSSLTGFVTETGSTQRFGNCNVSSGTTVICSLFSGSTIAASTAVTVELDAVVNPTASPSNTLQVSTTSDSVPATSAGYAVTADGQVSQATVTNASPTPAPNAATTYVIAFATSATGGLAGPAGSRITIVFPFGTGLGSLVDSRVTDVTSGSTVGNCTTSGLTATCSLFAGSAVAALDTISVQLDGVTNPPTSSPETLTVATSSDPSAVPSATYEVGEPQVATAAPSGVVDTSATLNGTVNADGSQVTDCHFDWGPTLAYGNTAPCDQPVGSGAATVAVSTRLTGLTANSTYHYRLVATNAGGTSVGADQPFATPATGSSTPPSAPVVSPSPPLVTSPTSVAVAGLVNPRGVSTSAHFEYGLDPKYSGGGAVVYDQSTPDVQLGSSSNPQLLSQTLTGLVPDALYHVRLIATNGLGTTIGDDQTFTTEATPAPPPPTIGKTVNLAPVSGLVLVKIPSGTPASSLAAAASTKGTVVKGKGFVPLTQARQLPVGSQIDSRRGSLRLVVAAKLKGRHTQQATLGGSVFNLAQARSGREKGLTTITLADGAFPGAPSYAKCAKLGKARTAGAGIASLNGTIIQTLRARDNHGSFRTRGRYGAGSVRGTNWDTSDRCDGTLFAVHRGTVDVLDFGRRTTVVVHAGRSYLARRAKP